MSEPWELRRFGEPFSLILFVLFVVKKTCNMAAQTKGRQASAGADQSWNPEMSTMGDVSFGSCCPQIGHESVGSDC